MQLVKHTADQVRLKVEAEQIFYAVWLICTKAFLWFTHQDVDYPEIVSGTFGIGGKGNCPPWLRACREAVRTSVFFILLSCFFRCEAQSDNSRESNGVHCFSRVVAFVSLVAY